MMDWELGVWGDGEVHLYYEDVIYGRDIDIILKQDGTVTMGDKAGEGYLNYPPHLAKFLRARAIEEIGGTVD